MALIWKYGQKRGFEMYCLSKLDGIPTIYKDGVKQFKEFIKESKKRSMWIFSGYLVFKRQEKGKYKGLVSTFHYITKPKKRIAIYKIK